MLGSNVHASPQRIVFPWQNSVVPIFVICNRQIWPTLRVKKCWSYTLVTTTSPKTCTDRFSQLFYWWTRQQINNDELLKDTALHHDVRRLMKQLKLTAIIQSHRFTLFGHIMRMDDNADAKRILLASRPADWRRQLGRPRITWLSSIQQYLKQHHLALPEAADLAQNRPLWRMMYGATQS